MWEKERLGWRWRRLRLWRRGLDIDILVLVDEEVDAFELGLSRGSNDAYYGAHPPNPIADPQRCDG